MTFRSLTAVAAPVAVALGALAAPANAASLQVLGTYETGVFAQGAAEIAAYDAASRRLFVVNANTNTIDILDISTPTTPTLFNTININALGSDFGGVNSVDVSNGLLAAAVQANVTQNPGSVVFFDIDGIFQNAVRVGALPDMLTFTPDGTKVLVANEGEPNNDYTIDPEGSVSIIDVSGGVAGLTDSDVRFATFNAFDSQRDALIAAGVRIFGPGASVSQDLEPEYIAVAPDGKTAWVALQENNAIAILDLELGEFTDILPLGYKDHSLPGNGLDASDRDGAINIATFPNLFGMYQPDAIASFAVDGVTYYATANEGDARDYDTFSEEARVNKLSLDPTAFPNAAELQANGALGRLTVTTTLGQNANGDYEALYVFGGRSFSIWREDGTLVWDGGDQFEQILAQVLPENFNANNDENQSFDRRSDNKGPEPEGITIGQIGDRIYAFIGLERVGGIMMYDVTNPANPRFVTYSNNRNFDVAFDETNFQAAGDLGPEGLLFIKAADSPNGQNLLVVTNEVSGTTTLYGIVTDDEGDDGDGTESVPEPGAVLGLLAIASVGALRLKRSR